MKHFRNFNFSFWLIFTLIISSLSFYGFIHGNELPKQESKLLVNRDFNIDKVNLLFVNGYSQIIQGKGSTWASDYYLLLLANKKYISYSQLDDYESLMVDINSIASAPTVKIGLEKYKAINYIVYK